MPKVRFRDFYQHPESFEDLTEDTFDDAPTKRTQPFFRDKKHRKQIDRLRDRISRQDNDEPLY